LVAVALLLFFAVLSHGEQQNQELLPLGPLGPEPKSFIEPVIVAVDKVGDRIERMHGAAIGELKQQISETRQQVTTTVWAIIALMAANLLVLAGILISLTIRGRP
jgi:hypothetical protein